MIPSTFDYVKASTVDEALAALAAAGEDAKVLGGGQSLLPVLRLRLNAPSVLVDVSGVDEMRSINDEGSSLLIGAAAAYFGAVLGGNHRDKQVIVEGWMAR